MSCECPMKKWEAHITQEEEYEINKKLDDKS